MYLQRKYLGKVLLTAPQSEGKQERKTAWAWTWNTLGQFQSAVQDTQQSKMLSHHSLVLMHEGCSHPLALSKHECADRKASWASLESALPASALCSLPVRTYLPACTAQPQVFWQLRPGKCCGLGAPRAAAATQMTVMSFCRQPRGGRESTNPPPHLWVFVQLQV